MADDLQNLTDKKLNTDGDIINKTGNAVDIHGDIYGRVVKASSASSVSRAIRAAPSITRAAIPSAASNSFLRLSATE